MASDTSSDNIPQEFQRQNHHSQESQFASKEQDLNSSNYTDVEAGNQGTETRWDGPDDSANPQNWPISKRVFHTALPALYGFVA